MLQVMIKGLQITAGVRTFDLAAPILKTLTRDPETMRVVDMKPGQGAKSIYDEVQGSQIVYMNEHAEVSSDDALLYNDIDAAEDRVLFPEEEQKDPASAAAQEINNDLRRFDTGSHLADLFEKFVQGEELDEDTLELLDLVYHGKASTKELLADFMEHMAEAKRSGLLTDDSARVRELDENGEDIDDEDEDYEDIDEDDEDDEYDDDDDDDDDDDLDEDDADDVDSADQVELSMDFFTILNEWEQNTDGHEDPGEAFDFMMDEDKAKSKNSLSVTFTSNLISLQVSMAPVRPDSWCPDAIPIRAGACFCCPSI